MGLAMAPPTASSDVTMCPAVALTKSGQQSFVVARIGRQDLVFEAMAETSAVFPKISPRGPPNTPGIACHRQDNSTRPYLRIKKRSSVRSQPQ